MWGASLAAARYGAAEHTKVMAMLVAEFEREPYPSEQELALIAKAVAAPGPAQARVPHHCPGPALPLTHATLLTAQVKTFFENMRLKRMSD